MAIPEGDPRPRVLAIAPGRRSFGYVVLEGPEFLVDWGVPRPSQSDTEFLARVEYLVDRYQPDVFIVEQLDERVRGKRVIRRMAKVERYAKTRGIPTVAVRRADVRLAFASSGTTKHEIAVAVSRLFPELELRLPPKRWWMAEAERMALFEACSLAVVALYGF